MYKRIIQIVIFITFYLAALCQPQDLSFHHLNVENGLSSTANLFFFKDSKGLIWISSKGGLNRYDGINVKHYFPVPNNVENSIQGLIIMSPFFEDDKTNIWFTTNKGLNCYHRKSDTFTYHPFTGDTNQNKIGCYAMALDAKQNLWIIVDDKLYTFNTKSSRWSYQHDVMPKALRFFPQFDQEGNPKYAFVTSHNADGIQYILYNENKIIGKNFLFNGINSELNFRAYDVHCEKDEIAWLATNQGLGNYNFARGQFKAYNEYQGNPIGFVTSVEPYQDSLLLAATVSHGLLVFSKKQETFVKKYTHNPLNTYSLGAEYLNNVQVIDDGIWLTVQSTGVDFTYPAKTKFSRALVFPADANLKKQFIVSALAEDKRGNIWVGSTHGGIAVFSKTQNEWRYFKPSDYPLLNAQISDIIIDRDNNIWVLTWYNLLRFNNETQQFDIQLGETQFFLSGLETNDGHILLTSGNGGIYKLNNTKGAARVEKIDQIPSDYPYSNLYQTKDGLLLGINFNSQLQVFDSRKNFAARNIPIDFSNIYSVYEPPNESVLWLGTENGLVKINKNDWKIKRIYTEQDGLPTRVISGILGDKTGQLWLSSANGLMRFNPENNNIRIYDMEDGLSSKEYSAFASIQDRSGQFWFGTKNGVTHFFPDQVKDLTILPTPGILDIIINDDPTTTEILCVETGATNPIEVRKIVQPFKHNTITFLFSALEYSAPSKNKYQYRMEGMDAKNSWAQVGNEGFARYANIPPGNYTFQVKAANSDGVWNEIPTEVKIEIQPPWYKTLLAKVIFLIFGVLVIMSALYIIYFRPAILVFDTREKVAADLHDDVGSDLNSVRSISKEPEKILLDEALALESFDRVHKISQDAAGKLRSMIWANNPANDSLEDIIVELRVSAKRVLGEQVKLNFDVDTIPLHRKLPGNKLYHLHLLYKEIMNNIAKHANASQVDVAFYYHSVNETLQLIVKDDGKGFDINNLKERPDTEEGGNGVHNLRGRAGKLEGDLNLQSLIGQGTTVSITFPIKNKKKMSLWDEWSRIKKVWKYR